MKQTKGPVSQAYTVCTEIIFFILNPLKRTTFILHKFLGLISLGQFLFLGATYGVCYVFAGDRGQEVSNLPDQVAAGQHHQHEDLLRHLELCLNHCAYIR